MASANVELVRSIYAAWERGDFSATGWAYPDIEYVFVDGPTPGSWKGLAGMAEAYRNFLSAWDDARSEADEFRELDDHRVLVLAHYVGRGKGSGLELGRVWTKVAALFEVTDGKVIRLALYFNPDRAFADLGLAPEGRE